MSNIFVYFICLFYSLNLFSGVQDFVKVYIQCLRSKALDVAVNRIGKLDRLIQTKHIKPTDNAKLLLEKIWFKLVQT